MGRPKLTESEIINKIETLGLTFVEFINYDGKNSSFLVSCELGHKPYITNLNTICKGRNAKGCPICKRLNKIKTNINKVGYHNVKKYCNDLGYILITEEEEYTGLDCLLSIKCNEGHLITTTFTNFKKRVKKCPECVKQQKINKAINRANELGYGINIYDYNGKLDKLNITCDKGHEWKPTYESFVYNGNKCLYCQYSKGEAEIEKFLIENNIDFSKQHQFNDCKYKKLLRFDFYLPNFNICIEYDGIQHFEPQDFFGGIDTYNDLHIKDEFKNEYCMINDIHLIRISYSEYEEIRYILQKELNL